MFRSIHLSAITTATYSTMTSLAESSYSCGKKMADVACRYFGAKSWSYPGRLYQISKSALLGDGGEISASKSYPETFYPLDKAASVRFLPYGAIVAASHNNDANWLKPWKLDFLSPKELNIDLGAVPGTIECREKCFFDKNSSLKALVVASQSSNKIVVVFGAVESGGSELETEKEIKDMHTYQLGLVCKNLLGLKLEIWEQARALFQAIKACPEFEGCEFTVCGLCFGALIAQMVAIKEQTNCICFNSLPLGAGAQKELGSALHEKGRQYITHISVETDFVSDPQGIAFLDKCLTRLGFTMPGNFGDHYLIPNAYAKSRAATHAYFMGSLMQLNGYSRRDKSDKLKEEDLQSSLLDRRSKEEKVEELVSDFCSLIEDEEWKKLQEHLEDFAVTSSRADTKGIEDLLSSFYPIPL